jgi:dipeptidase D
MPVNFNELKPTELWQHFAALNAVPRASKKEGQVIQFMLDFGKQLNLQTYKDDIGNVIIKKPATAGMENKQTVCLQSHLDMVHQKNADTDFDFATQGIDMFIENDWVKAKGTTLGADNGIGVASIMALLASTDIPHPALEALFTIDEETGMTGALGLKGGLLDAEILLNLDTEDDDELTIGCAGGIDVGADGKYETEKTAADVAVFRITVKGLTGGHSVWIFIREEAMLIN